jgi:microcystin-dependent protein
MPTLTITKTYQDGNVLSEADLDNIKDSIETFINVTKLDDDNLQDNGISSDKFTVATRALLVPTGAILDYGGVTAPSGYLLCYGQEVSQVTYDDLFTAIGTTWNTGGEGAGNFRLPDLRGRASFGQDDMGGVSANRITTPNGDTLGATGGAESLTLTSTELPAHTHSLTDPGHTHLLIASDNVSDALTSGNRVSSAFDGFGGAVTNYSLKGSASSASIGLSASSTTGISATNSTGTGSAFSILNPLAIVNKIIKT